MATYIIKHRFFSIFFLSRFAAISLEAKRKRMKKWFVGRTQRQKYCLVIFLLNV